MNLDHLERLARAASPGPWAWEGDSVCSRLVAPDGTTVLDDGSAGGEYSEEISPDTPDGQYVAAANPQAVLALIAVARAAQAYCDEPPFHPGDPDTRFAELSSALAALGR